MDGVEVIMEGGPLDGEIVTLPKAIPFVKFPILDLDVGVFNPRELIRTGHHLYTKTNRFSAAEWSLGALVYKFTETIPSQ
jgi:hypothetical protein